jgi:hypothetical protein
MNVVVTDDSEYVAIERRIERFIIGLSLIMASGAAVGWGSRAAGGVAAGAVLCWLNFRWLRQGAAGLTRLGLAQAGVENVHVPRRVHAKFLGRLALLVAAAYAMLALLRWPVVAVLCGLAAVVPAIALELGYELIHGHHRWNAQ